MLPQTMPTTGDSRESGASEHVPARPPLEGAETYNTSTKMGPVKNHLESSFATETSSSSIKDPLGFALESPSPVGEAVSEEKRNAGQGLGSEIARPKSTASVIRVPTTPHGESLQRVLAASPVYPWGDGGRLTSISPTNTTAQHQQTDEIMYKIAFDDGVKLGTPRSTAPCLPTLEATREHGGAYSIRGHWDQPDTGGRKPVIARIEPARARTGEGEEFYSLGLVDGAEAGAGEIMAVRVATHSTRLAATRDVEVVVLHGDETAEIQQKTSGGICVWPSSMSGGKDGLWQAAAEGRVGGGALKLRNKTAVWSGTTKSFELDLLEAWCPGGSLPGTSSRSPQAPETMQMVTCSTSEDGASARSDVGRVPSMQLVRLSERQGEGGLSLDGAEAKAPTHEGAKVECRDVAGDRAEWMLAVSSPMSALQGFALAIIGLESDVLGAGVTVVDRSAAAKETESAAGFLGFNEALYPAPMDSTSGLGGTEKPLISARSITSSRSRASPAVVGSRDGGSARLSQYSAISDSDELHESIGADRVDSDGGVTGIPRSNGGGCMSVLKQSAVDDGPAPPVPVLPLEMVAAPFVEPDQVRRIRGKSISAEVRFNLDEGTDLDVIKPQASRLCFEDEGAGISAPLDQEHPRGGGSYRGNDIEEAVGGRSSSAMVVVPVKRRMSVQAVAADVVDKVYRNTYVCNMCLLMLTVSFVADLYPGVPSYNAPLSAGLLWASCNVDAVRALRRRSLSYMLSTLVLLSLITDAGRLVSGLETYAVYEFNLRDGGLDGTILENDMKPFARVIIGAVAMLKAFSWQGILATSPQGVHTLNVIWRKFKLFLPIWGSPANLTKEVYNRIVALAWVHVFGSAALAVMAGIGALGFDWAPQFASFQGAGAPLTVVCLFKSFTSLLVSGALFRNMDLALCLNVFGCLACFRGWHEAREERRHARHGVTYPKVILEWDYIMLCGYIKIFDLLLGLWLWTALGWSWSEDRAYAERHSIRMLLLAITSVQTLTDIWCVFLGVTVLLLVSQYLLRKEKSVHAARNAFGDYGDQDGDVEIARSLATGRLLPDSVMSDESSFGRRSDDHGGSRIMSSEEERAREVMESDCDSYSTGESETEKSDGSAEKKGAAEKDDTTNGSIRRGTLSGVDVNLGRSSFQGETSEPAYRGRGDDTSRVTKAAQPASEQGTRPAISVLDTAAAIRRRRKSSMFATGGSRLVYKRAFSARSSSDDSTVEGSSKTSPLPASIALDRSFVVKVEDFRASWASLETCASFRCRIGKLPEICVMETHLREQGFSVVASGVISDHTKIYICARAVGFPPLFFAQLVFERAMHELAFAFKCEDERFTPRFVCHMHLRRVIGDHQPIT